MKLERLKYFIKILKIELDAFDEELLALEELYKQKLSQDQITNYVFLENSALLENEFKSIKQIQEKLDNFPLDEQYEMETFIEVFQKFVHSLCHKNQCPGVVERVVMVKAEKVFRYLQETN